MARRFGLGWAAASLILVLGPAAALAVESPGDWSQAGRSTYEGTWTLVEYVHSADIFEPEYEVGDTRPGAVHLQCDTPVAATACDFYATLEDDRAWWASTVEPAGSAYRSVTDHPLGGCGGVEQIFRVEVDVEFGPEAATGSIAELNIPRVCEESDGSVFESEDKVWTFEGPLTVYVPPAGGAPPDDGDLGSYLAGYGLECGVDGRVCRRIVPDADYRVETTTGPDGAVTAIQASVTSFDPSMPSDAGGFLRGVAERAPVPETEALVAWFDGAIAGGDPAYADGAWTATWSATEVGDGAVWALELAGEEAGAPAAAAPSVGPVPGPTEGAEIPLPSVVPGTAGDADGVGTFARSIPTPTAVSTDPSVVLQSAILAALLVFLMPFPSQLFNSTLETHEGEVRRWLRLDRLGAAVHGIGAFSRSWLGVAVFTAIAALLYGFLDPGFGLDLGSLATFLGMLLGIVLVTLAFAIPTVLAHRRLGDRPRPAVVPVSLLVGVICVLVSRLTDFQPGYLYGLLIGLAFARELSAADEGRATALGAALMLGLAFAAWLALGALPDGDGFGVLVVRTALAALMVAGLEGVVFGLLPMRFLPGETLYGWNRVLWAGLLLVGAFAFFHILINPASGYLSDTTRTPLLTVVALLLGFSLVSVAFWAWFRFRPEPTGSASPE